MKFRLPVGVCIAISLVLVLFGLLYGTMSGYREDRAQVTAHLEGENGLFDVLSYRGADGLNLCVVAERHLANDSDVSALMSAAKALRSGGESITQKKQENEKLEAAVSAVAQKLSQTESFMSSARDQKYMDMLVNDMQSLARSVNTAYYNEKAREFNKSLKTPVLGQIAVLLGVKPCELYE